MAIYKAISATGEKIDNKNILAIGKNKNFLKNLKDFFAKKKIKINVINFEDANLTKQMKKADILISIVGQPNYIKTDMIKEDAALIDCGIERQGKKVIGDVDIKNVKKKAGWITPVPGGIGPITVAMLLHNTVKLYNQHK